MGHGSYKTISPFAWRNWENEIKISGCPSLVMTPEICTSRTFLQQCMNLRQHEMGMEVKTRLTNRMPSHIRIHFSRQVSSPRSQWVLSPCLPDGRDKYWYILLTAIGFKPGGSCKYTFTHKRYTKQHNETIQHIPNNKNTHTINKST